ncbi:MAG: helix-turn-helix transcriptional regulator [Rhodanobacteraceae bacterium]
MAIVMPGNVEYCDATGPSRAPAWVDTRPANAARPVAPLRIVACRLDQARVLRWSKDGNARAGLIYGDGGGCGLDVDEGIAAVWMPLRGALQVVTGYGDRPVHAKGAMVTECSASVRVRGRASGRWLVIVGDQRTWHHLLAGTAAIDRQLLPEQYVASRTLRQHAIALIRDASGPVGREATLRALAGLVADLQAPLYAAIARCPGRTYVQRRQVFVRLQRVRLFMAACCERELDNDALARMASYSPHHFLHTFKCVYLETPHAYLVQQRLLRARRMLSQERLAITEIALACGFENPSAFSRLFHQHFGATAKQTRLQLQVGPDR